MNPTETTDPRPRSGTRWPGLSALIVGAVLAMALWMSFVSVATPVSITVPLRDVPVADSDLDGEPSTGAWSDALAVDMPLENGAQAPYGTATLYAKHDGSNLYMRLDGAIDVAWLPSAEYFWLGIQISPTYTSHHGGGDWDGIFFGLWDGSEYLPQPTYPPRAVDTHGFDRPPVADTLQDALGTMRYRGTGAPYSFTAEWRRPLRSGDGEDLSYQADGATVYNFFVTTDSDGSGSAGGSIAHRMITNLNVMKIEVAQSTGTPPTIVHNAPTEAVTGENITLTARIVDVEGVAEVRLNYTDISGAQSNVTMTLEGSVYTYTIPPQGGPGMLTYLIWAVDVNGKGARTALYSVLVTKLLRSPSIEAVLPMAPGCLSVTWLQAEDPEVAGFRLYRWNSSSTAMEQIAILPGNATAYEDCALDSGRVYTYWIITFDASGNDSPPSAMVSGRTEAPTGPEAELLLSGVVLGVIATLVASVLVLFFWRRGLRKR